MTSRGIVAKRHLETLKKNSGGNRFKDYGKVETAVTRTLITHGNEWYQQGTEQLLWRDNMLNASIVTGLGEKCKVRARKFKCEILKL